MTSSDNLFPSNAPNESEGEDSDEMRMPLLEHLRELRHRLVVSLAATLIGVLLCFTWVEPIWNFLVDPMNDAIEELGRGTMAINEPLEGFMTYLKVAGLAGVLCASPVIFYQAWKFMAPGLYPKEKKTVVPLVICSTLLFFAGAGFGYSVIFRFMFPFFLEVTTADIEPVLSISSYLGIATKLLLAFGFCFQLPVVIFFLSRIGLIHHRDMISGFKYAVVGIFVVASLITPPDLLSQFLMAGPLIILYGFGIIVSRIFSTKPLNPDADA